MKNLTQGRTCKECRRLLTALISLVLAARARSVTDHEAQCHRSGPRSLICTPTANFEILVGTGKRPGGARNGPGQGRRGERREGSGSLQTDWKRSDEVFMRRESSVLHGRLQCRPHKPAALTWF
eukprot:768291-Hanusia_phi.AAC.9